MVKLSKKKKEEIIKKYGKVPTKEELFEKIKESQERMIVSLALAWEEVPNDPKIRAKLLKATEKAVKLREKLYEDIIGEEAPDIKKSYERLKEILKKEASSN